MNKQIPYTILRQLKESGFPDDGDPYNTGEYIFGIPQREIDLVLLDKHPDFKGKVDEIFNLSISLEKLIEECGGWFKKLEPLGGGLFWRAESIEMMGIKIGLQGGGKTPNEAVARLWLELNKKK